MLTVEVPVSVFSDAWKEVTAEAVGPVCRWLRVSTDFGLANHPTAERALNRMGEVAPRSALGDLQEMTGEVEPLHAGSMPGSTNHTRRALVLAA